MQKFFACLSSAISMTLTFLIKVHDLLITCYTQVLKRHLADLVFCQINQSIFSNVKYVLILTIISCLGKVKSRVPTKNLKSSLPGTKKFPASNKKRFYVSDNYIVIAGVSIYMLIFFLFFYIFFFKSLCTS